MSLSPIQCEMRSTAMRNVEPPTNQGSQPPRLPSSLMYSVTVLGERSKVTQNGCSPVLRERGVVGNKRDDNTKSANVCARVCV